MKKLIALLLALVMVISLAACTAENSTTAPSTSAPVESTPDESTPDESTPDESEPAEGGEPAELTVIDVSDYFGDDAKWEDDSGYHERTAESILFDNFSAGDYCALRLTEEAQNVTYKFSVTINELAPVTVDDGTWWDSELLIVARSSVAGSSWDDDGSRKGYTLTSWGDMSEVCIGRCGYDDAFGTFAWNINDGEAHEIEFTVENNADNTEVTITLVVDGVEIASVVDDGSLVKNERPSLYPDAGGLTIRCKWLEAIIG